MLRMPKRSLAKELILKVSITWEEQIFEFTTLNFAFINIRAFVEKSRKPVKSFRNYYNSLIENNDE